MQFTEGQLVVHPHHGPCVVTGVVTRTIKGVDRQYVDLRVQRTDLVLSVPAEGVQDVGLRPVFGAAELARLAEVLRALPRLGFVGINVTIPHKEAVLTLADAVTDRAALIGAANTLVFRGGRIHADNTDGYGFVANLRQHAPDWVPAAGAAAVHVVDSNPVDAGAGTTASSDVADLAARGAARLDRGPVGITLDRPVVAVGPEGGWSDGERALLADAVGLGPHVLRAETAAITAGALLGAMRSGWVG